MTSLLNPSILPNVMECLAKYKQYITLNAMKKTCHVMRNHHEENKHMLKKLLKKYGLYPIKGVLLSNGLFYQQNSYYKSIGGNILCGLANRRLRKKKLNKFSDDAIQQDNLKKQSRERYHINSQFIFEKLFYKVNETLSNDLNSHLIDMTNLLNPEDFVLVHNGILKDTIFTFFKNHEKFQINCCWFGNNNKEYGYVIRWSVADDFLTLDLDKLHNGTTPYE